MVIERINPSVYSPDIPQQITIVGEGFPSINDAWAWIYTQELHKKLCVAVLSSDDSVTAYLSPANPKRVKAAMIKYAQHSNKQGAAINKIAKVLDKEALAIEPPVKYVLSKRT